MILSIAKDNPTYRKHFLFGVFLLVHLTIGLYYLQGYMAWRSVNFVIAICGLPLIIAHGTFGKPSYRFLVMGLVSGLVSFFMPINTMVFLTLTLCCLGLAELFYGKTSVIPLLIILLLSPLSHIITIFSFPVRLWLTGVAAEILKLTGADVVSSGNIIVYAGSDYTVDPACMGLKMLATSLWLSLYMLHFVQKMQQRYLKLTAILLVLCIVFLLNLATNLARIVLLVYFDISPAHIMHDITGLGCFVIYTVLPLTFLLAWQVRILGEKQDVSTSTVNPKISLQVLLALLTVATVCIAGKNAGFNSTSLTPPVEKKIAGYTSDEFSPGVIRLKNDKSLIYLKPIPAFYSVEHNPLMCWVGSGYEFEQLNETSLGLTSIYTGRLKGEKGVLYTAWWYDDGQTQTISQVDWRWRMLTGKSKYTLVNVTCNSKAELMNEAKFLVGTGNLCNILR